MVFSRRPDPRFNRGRIAVAAGSSSPPVTPLTILGADTLQWCRADTGVTIDTGVSAWADQSGNDFHYLQATGTAQPAFGATAGPNSTPALTLDGADDILVASGLTLPAPGTRPVWIWTVLKQVSWVNARRIFATSSSNNTMIAYQAGASPQIHQYNTTGSANGDAAIGAWVALQTAFTNSTSDFIAVNDNAPVTGVNTGNTGGGTGRSLGGSLAGNYSNIAVAEIVYAKVIPSAGQIAAFSAYRLARYGF